MLPGEPFDFCRDHFHFKVSMEVGVPNVPGRVNDGLEYFVLKHLDDSIGNTGAISVPNQSPPCWLASRRFPRWGFPGMGAVIFGVPL
jgi:hypothetical protein